MGKFCDLQRTRCVASDGACENVADCGFADERLASFGKFDCEQGSCTLNLNPAPVSSAISSNDQLGSINVSQPKAAERISNVADYVFRFDAGSGIAVAAILDRMPDNIDDDADDAAIWVAYLSSGDARKGIRLNQGNTVNGAKSLLDDPRTGKTLYFLAITFVDGVRQAKSPAVPFSIGAPYQEVDGSCNGANDTLCSSPYPLICVDGFCRAACLSNVDCAEGTCAPPGRHGIKSGVCL
ncbi:MAG TPA: hypothetical protein VHC69_19370 [Polyangiaceae bacterium]|nr:hypothetical protein [Polyangiaceae bacterium]